VSSNYFGSGLGGSLSRGLGDFFGSRTATPSNIEKLEDWQLMAMAGGDPAEVERLRLANQMYGTGALAGVSRALGVEPAQEQRGSIETLVDWATRPQAAITGAVTGALGMERTRVTQDEGRILDTPEREGALERFIKGLTGQEKYRAADFRGLAYDRETTSTPQRAMRSATGFLLDVALDPLTYVSFGGSILGRKAGSVAVNAQARRRLGGYVSAMDDTAKIRTVREAITRQGLDQSQLRANLVNEMRENGLEDLVKKMNLDEGLFSADELVQVASQLGALDSLVMDSLASMMAGTYRAMGSGGTRLMLREGFGEAGEQMWRELPLDLRGGIRFRVPFMRDEAGLPIAYGVGDGRLLDSVPGGGALRTISNQGREYMRQLPLFKKGGNNMSGAVGATDRKVASEIWKKERDRMGRVWGEVGEGGTVTWKQWNDLNNKLSDFRVGSYSAMRHLISDVHGVQENHALALSGANADEYRDAFNALMKEDLVSVSHFLTDRPDVLKGVDDLFTNPTEWQVQAYNSASAMQLALKRTESVLMDAFDGDIDRVFVGLEQYWPRMAEDINRALGKGGSPRNLMNREKYVSIVDAAPGGGVLRWMTPPDIAAKYAGVPGATLFEEDPVAALIPYIIGMNRLAASEKLIKDFLSAGLVFRGGARDAVPDLDAAVFAARDFRNRLLATEQGLRGVGVLSSRERADSANAVLSGFRQHGRRMLTRYTPGSIDVVRNYIPGASRVWVASDNAMVVELADGSFQAFIPSRGFLSDGKFVRDGARGNVFPDHDSAEIALNGALRQSRESQYVKETQEAVDEFFDNLTENIRTIERTPGGASMYDDVNNTFHPGNIPYDDQEKWFDAVVDMFKRYGDNKTYRSRGDFGKKYKEQGYGLVSEGVSMDSPQMGQYMKSRFEEAGLFSSEALVDDMRRIWQAQADPTPLGKWVEEFYKPFYSTQKALMTSQRGPGYVFRNIIGGMWNAYLVGVQGRHWATARVVQNAALEAEKFAKTQSDDLNQQLVIAAKRFEASLSSEFGVDKTRDMLKAWNIYQLRGGARSIAGKTVGVQATARPTGIEGSLVDPLFSESMSRSQRAAQYLTQETAWARFMGGMASDSEDFLRFGTFLKGIDDFGLDDGGYAAYMLVKATQFDYGDLSMFESDVLKMVMPFYTWTRNNVPLQLRAMMTTPEKVTRAIRINDALRDAFGEYDPEDEPLPAFVRERFGWRIRQDLLQGPMGDALAGGLIVGEPLIDVNRLLRAPEGGRVSSMINMREIANSLNPTIGAATEALTGIELSTGGRMPRREEAPLWAMPFGSRNLEGDIEVSSRALRLTRSMVPPLSIAERMFPGVIGNERMERRVYTSWASQLFGLPMSTLDPYQTGAELRRREQATRGRLERRAGDTLQDKIEFLRPLVNANVPPQDLALIRALVVGKPNATADDFLNAPADRVDPQVGLKLALQVQAISQMTNPLDRAMAFSQLSYEPRPVSERGRGFLTEEDLEELGLTPSDVGKMSRTQLLGMLDQFARR
jgi:hypothetical protein